MRFLVLDGGLFAFERWLCSRSRSDSIWHWLSANPECDRFLVGTAKTGMRCELEKNSGGRVDRGAVFQSLIVCMDG